MEEENRNTKTAVDFGVTQADFDQWRLPREGTANPTRMDNAVWNWLINTRISGYQATKEMHAESGCGATWSFDRFGRSTTSLPDGRVIHIGGEHEDYYDPDFYIYNDVVVVGLDEKVSIFGYPITVFPPTDFHSATLVGNKIYVIGNLGYTSTRADNLESIYILDTDSFELISKKPLGELPDWIHKHSAELVGDSIRISGGLVEIHAQNILAENLNTWELSLSTLSWKLINRLPWRRWEFRRPDKKVNGLWEIRSALFSKKYIKDQLQENLERIVARIGQQPDLESILELYRFSVEHKYLGEDEEALNTHRIEMDGVIVRFVEHHHAVQMTVKGALSDERIEILIKELRQKLSALEATEYNYEEIP